MNIRTISMMAAAFLLPSITSLAQPAPDTSAIWTLQDENASISTANLTDRYYVNGLRLGWTSPTVAVPNFLADVARTLWGNGQPRVAIDLAQQIYTPADTAAFVPNPHDRPYAGVLLTNLSLMSDAEDSRSVLMLSLGVVGPGSGAENLQNGFHNLIGQAQTNGWAFQIPNTPAINLLHERTWRIPLGTVGGLETDTLPALTVAVGDLRTYLQTGIQFRIGQGLNSDFGVPRVRPGLSGGDAFVPSRPFAWYAFAGVDGQAVAYDMLLTANPFRSGPHVSAIWDVGEVQAGFALIAYGMRLTFAWVAQTQEFHGQAGGLHQFGSAALSVRF